MGVWGPYLYDSDLTNDVKDTYIGFLYSGIDDNELKSKMLMTFNEVLETEDVPFFWYAYADVSFKYGRIDEQIKNTALYYIDKKQELDIFDEYREYWFKTLEKLRVKISQDAPKKKKISIIENSSPWNIGDLYAYRLRSKYAKEKGHKDKYIVLLKVGIERHFNPPYRQMNVFVIYDKFFDIIPEKEELVGIRHLVQTKYDDEFYSWKHECEHYEDYEYYMENVGPFLEWIMETGNVFNENDFTFLGNIDVPDAFRLEGERHKGRVIEGKIVNNEKWFIQYHESWLDKEY